jgi:hypothetical protein
MKMKIWKTLITSMKKLRRAERFPEVDDFALVRFQINKSK